MCGMSMLLCGGHMLGDGLGMLTNILVSALVVMAEGLLFESYCMLGKESYSWVAAQITILVLCCTSVISDRSLESSSDWMS